MAAGQWNIYNEFKAAIGTKPINLNADSIKVALFLSTSNCGNAALTTAQYATLTNQHAAASGYTTGGVVCTPSYSQTSGVATFDTADASFTASGGSIVARFAVVYDDTVTNKDLICYCLLDTTPADVTVTTGNIMLIQIANIYTMT